MALIEGELVIYRGSRQEGERHPRPRARGPRTAGHQGDVPPARRLRAVHPGGSGFVPGRWHDERGIQRPDGTRTRLAARGSRPHHPGRYGRAGALHAPRRERAVSCRSRSTPTRIPATAACSAAASGRTRSITTRTRLVIFQPFRYWDRFAARRSEDDDSFSGVHDHPEASFFEFGKKVRAGYWKWLHLVAEPGGPQHRSDRRTRRTTRPERTLVSWTSTWWPGSTRTCHGIRTTVVDLRDAQSHTARNGTCPSR